MTYFCEKIKKPLKTPFPLFLKPYFHVFVFLLMYNNRAENKLKKAKIFSSFRVSFTLSKKNKKMEILFLTQNYKESSEMKLTKNIFSQRQKNKSKLQRMPALLKLTNGKHQKLLFK